MANATADYGFVPLYSLSGDIRNINCAVLAAATDLYVGDPVKFSGTGDSSGRPSITRADAGDDTVMGVIIGFKASGPDNLNQMYSTGADTAIVTPTLAHTVFRVNAGGTTGVDLNDIGNCFNHVYAAGDALTGKSGCYIDSTTAATTGTTWRLIGFADRPDNEFSATVSTDTLDTDILVTCVESIWVGHNGTGGDGV